MDQPPDRQAPGRRELVVRELREVRRPRTYLAGVRAFTLAAFVIIANSTGGEVRHSMPAYIWGAAALYVLGACILGSLRLRWRALDVTLLAATVCADIAWCTAAFIYFGPDHCLPAVIYASLMAAMAALVSPAAAIAIGISAAAAYVGTVVVVHGEVAASPVTAQLVGLQAATMALAGILSGSITDHLTRLRRSREMVERLERLNLATADAAATRGDGALKLAAVKHAVETVHATRAWIMLLNESQCKLRLDAFCGLEPSEELAGAVHSPTGVAGEILRTGSSVAIHLTSDKSVRLSPVERELADDQLLAVPLPAGGSVHGALFVSRPNGEKQFTEEDLALLTLFGRSVGGALETAGLIRDLHLSSTMDPLTGLYNHRAFFELLADQVQVARETEQDLSLIVLDLDNFKQVNDTSGHWQGDRVLRTLADTLRRNFRETDIIGRCGGDEFAVLLPFTDPARSVEIAERAAVALTQTARGVGVTVAVSASWGVASFPVDATTDEGLFREADTRLYEAKAAGGNHVAFEAGGHKPRVIAAI